MKLYASLYRASGSTPGRYLSILTRESESLACGFVELWCSSELGEGPRVSERFRVDLIRSTFNVNGSMSCRPLAILDVFSLMNEMSTIILSNIVLLAISLGFAV